MASILALSQDVSAAEPVEKIAAELGFRIRTLTTFAAAKEWLAIQPFDCLIVDSRLDEQSSLALIRDAWKKYPLLTGILFNPQEAVKTRWLAALQGVLVVQPPDAYSQLREQLKAVPQALSLGEDTKFAVLVVEDLDSPRDIICAYIESLGYNAVHGANGAIQAMEILNKSPDDYFCVITDLQMPRISGQQLIAEIRAHKLVSHLPVIVLTSQSSPDNLLDCVRAGASGFLVKPPKKQQLQAELEKAKRIILHNRSPRLCSATDAHLLENALRAIGLA